MTPTLYAFYGVPAFLLLAWYMRAHSRREQQNREVLREALATGMTEPASLHPKIDLAKCIGCGSCVEACPEQGAHTVLGIIRGKARLVSPTNCIGHGACKASCPVDAISLVFGTATRGIDIPVVSADFETVMPGIFIAGELGGMGLIRNAIEQGRQAVDAIIPLTRDPHGHELDLLIVGAGPAGIAATLAAKAGTLNSLTLEQDSLGGTVAHFPRRKLVMTQPAELPLVGKVQFKEVQKEELIAFWEDVERKTGIEINYQECVESIKPTEDNSGYQVTTNTGSYTTRTVLLAIGRRGTPRKLDVPGEERTKVAYRLIDPEQYRDMQVLVVGGGDSALEAATSIAEEHGTTVTLSYRSAAFSRAKQKNREKLAALQDAGRLTVLMNSSVLRIDKESVTIASDEQEQSLANDAVIISAGGILPTAFLRKIGIHVETKWGTE